MTDKELREVLAEELNRYGQLLPADAVRHGLGMDYAAAAAVAAMRRVAAQVRAETVEEAAKIADNHATMKFSNHYRWAARDTARAIRALLNKENVE